MANRLTSGGQAVSRASGPPRTLRDLHPKSLLASASRSVAHGITRPLLDHASLPATTATFSSVTAGRPCTVPNSLLRGGLRRSSPSSTGPAPLRRRAHLGGSIDPPFVSSTPKIAQLGLRSSGSRGFHSGAGRQVLQNVVENAPLGVRAGWELDWRKKPCPPSKGLARGKRGEQSKKGVEKVDAMSTTSFDRYFPPVVASVDEDDTVLLSIPLASPAPVPSDWTDLFSPPPAALSLTHPLLPRPVVSALKHHMDVSSSHNLRLRSLFTSLSHLDRGGGGGGVRAAWTGPEGTLVIRLSRRLALRLVQGREGWVRLMEEETPVGHRLARWRLQAVDADPPESDAGDGSAWDGADSVWSDLATHDRVASRFVMPSSSLLSP